MKTNLFKLLIKIGAIAPILFFGSCGSDDSAGGGGNPPCVESTWYQDLDGDGLGNPSVSTSACEQPDGYVSNALDDDDTDDGSVETSGEDLTTKLNGSDVIMQGFYWDVEPREQWYNVVTSKLDDWASSGIGKIWMPAPGKGNSGSFSMGYDPYDYFDVGEFDQKGGVKTRFGSREELETLINSAHDLDMEVLADIVLNHNSGADQQEVNPLRGDGQLYWTKFFPASGKFNRTYEDFHPNSVHNGQDEGNLFFSETDLCHEVPRVRGWLWEDEGSVADFYQNTLGFDGWRFDYVKGFGTQWINDWMATTGGFAVGENWDGNVNVLRNWVDATGVSAFDFAMFYIMERAFDGNNLAELTNRSGMLWNDRPFNSVTFVSNHDTEKDTNPGNVISASNKSLAYAYMLTHEGYPCVFYLDYEGSRKNELKNLILINNSIAYGTTEILYGDNNEYIARRNGDIADGKPGLIVYLSLGNSDIERQVQTNWNEGDVLVDYSGNLTEEITVGAGGMATIKAPTGRSYSIWSLKDF